VTEVGSVLQEAQFAGSILIEVIAFFNLPDPGVDSASNRYEYQESSLGKGQPARKADSLNAMCEPIV
jgi:hypothetical protein